MGDECDVETNGGLKKMPTFVPEGYSINGSGGS